MRTTTTTTTSTTATTTATTSTSTSPTTTSTTATTATTGDLRLEVSVNVPDPNKGKFWIHAKTDQHRLVCTKKDERTSLKLEMITFFLNVGILMLELMLELGLGLEKKLDSSGPDPNKVNFGVMLKVINID